MKQQATRIFSHSLHPESDGLQPKSDGLHSSSDASSDGPQPQPISYGLQPEVFEVRTLSKSKWQAPQMSATAEAALTIQIQTIFWFTFFSAVR